MVEVLTDAHRGELQQIFERFDSSSRGFLDVRELNACFRSFGCVYTEADLQEMMNEEAEKKQMMTKKMKDCDVVAEIKLAFTQLDEDGDLNINRSELRAVLEKLTDGRVRAEEADVDGDGKISQLDFINFLTT
ncbi:hypothetical protein GUITHDRAFT_114622 [Guillardia theta CCMP2712]|uniref:EF-hand domain-containing protein n=1 Tax=Guillardia theta (strain CCMP2712) TaxID=905079 RepID=L1ISV7_GUITC|nr:hypothetical protein GUITHDRAFT_114622 [Guillardia theta CCMP2712]EKX39192.1 hypothetical protein GUITHDRAFT_114622 [Guillardia theta CCMP2712]|eukprot:XP_005826172.1 hypothetical protein GUITHDRAFT_114622 [Guillardia theta CCMP2712]